MNKTPPVIRLTGYYDRSAMALVELARSYRIKTIVDICDRADESVNAFENCRTLREILHNNGITLHLAGRQLTVFPMSSDHSIHTSLDLTLRGFAEHMCSDLFKIAIDQLTALARKQLTLVIGGDDEFEVESRYLLADYLFLIEGFQVLHLAQDETISEHQPTSMARVGLNDIIYDRLADEPRRYH